MARKSREEIVLKKTEGIISKLHEQDINNIELEEYEKLYIEYRKLTKRYNKIVKMNDSMQSKIMKDNDSLSEDKVNIIKLSKKKIMSNIAENRKIKEEHSKTLSNLTTEINSIKNHKNIASEYKVGKEIESTKLEINLLKNKNETLTRKVSELKEFIPSLETYLNREMNVAKKTKEPLVFCMLGIDKFNDIKDKVDSFTTRENFLLGLLKYIKNSVDTNDIVAHHKGEIFYIISQNNTAEKMLKKCQSIGRRKVINSLNISISSCVTELTTKDEYNDVIIRTAAGYKESILDKRDGKVIEV
ncbi:MAG: diguanylate cyclase [Campylobacterota bacterium]|nr:diguanylate cyclase [Campylobacterota bacterium]